MKSKPVKFVIVYYVVVGWNIPYLHSLWDNNHGKTSAISPPVAYCTLFRELRNVYELKIDPNLVRKYSPSALLFLQMAN